MQIKYIIISLLWVNIAWGQWSESFTFGLKAGINLAIVPEVLEEVKENHSKPRVNIGLFTEFLFSDHFSLRNEAEYSLKGTDAVFILENDVFQEGIDVNTDLNLDYLSFPMSLRWRFYDNFYLGGGGYLAFLIKNKVHVYTPSYVQEQYGVSANAEGDFKEVMGQLSLQGHNYNVTLNKMDYGALIETGYNFEMGLELSTRFTKGLRPIIEGDDFNVTPKNEVFYFGVGYRF